MLVYLLLASPPGAGALVGQATGEGAWALQTRGHHPVYCVFFFLRNKEPAGNLEERNDRT